MACTSTTQRSSEQKLESQQENQVKTKKSLLKKKKECYSLNVKTSEGLFWSLHVFKVLIPVFPNMSPRLAFWGRAWKEKNLKEIKLFLFFKSLVQYIIYKTKSKMFKRSQILTESVLRIRPLLFEKDFARCSFSIESIIYNTFFVKA